MKARLILGVTALLVLELVLWWQGLLPLCWLVAVALGTTVLGGIVWGKLWENLNSKRRIAKFLLILFVFVLFSAFVIPGNVLYPGPSLEIPIMLYGGTRIEGHPLVTYYMSGLITTSGGFSVGNSVHIHIRVSNVNETNLLNDYCCVSLSNALNIPPLRGTGNFSGFFFEDRITLIQQFNGSYTGDDYVIFTQPGNQNISLTIAPNPANPKLIVVTSDHLKLPLPGHPGVSEPAPRIVTISDASSTLTADSTRFVARIAIIIGAFSIIVLQPLLEDVLLPEPPPCNTIQPTPQSTPLTMKATEVRRWLKRHPDFQLEEGKEVPQESEKSKD